MTSQTPLAAAMQTLRSTATHMQQDARFKVVFEEFPALVAEDIEAWEQWLQQQPGMEGYTIPDELRHLYRATGGFRFRWQYLPAKNPTTGSAELVDLMSLYHRDDEHSTPVSSIYTQPRSFDIIDQQEKVVIRFSRQPHSPLSLVRVDASAGTEHPLTLQPAGYFRFMAIFAARYDWQRLFEAGNSPGSADVDRLKHEVESLIHPH